MVWLCFSWIIILWIIYKTKRNEIIKDYSDSYLVWCPEEIVLSAVYSGPPSVNSTTYLWIVLGITTCTRLNSDFINIIAKLILTLWDVKAFLEQWPWPFKKYFKSFAPEPNFNNAKYQLEIVWTNKKACRMPFHNYYSRITSGKRTEERISFLSLGESAADAQQYRHPYSVFLFWKCNSHLESLRIRRDIK